MGLAHLERAHQALLDILEALGYDTHAVCESLMDAEGTTFKF